MSSQTWISQLMPVSGDRPSEPNKLLFNFIDDTYPSFHLDTFHSIFINLEISGRMASFRSSGVPTLVQSAIVTNSVIHSGDPPVTLTVTLPGAVTAGNTLFFTTLGVHDSLVTASGGFAGTEGFYEASYHDISDQAFGVDMSRATLYYKPSASAGDTSWPSVTLTNTSGLTMPDRRVALGVAEFSGLANVGTFPDGIGDYVPLPIENVADGFTFTGIVVPGADLQRGQAEQLLTDQGMNTGPLPGSPDYRFGNLVVASISIGDQGNNAVVGDINLEWTNNGMIFTSLGDNDGTTGTGVPVNWWKWAYAVTKRLI